MASREYKHVNTAGVSISPFSISEAVLSRTPSNSIEKQKFLYTIEQQDSPMSSTTTSSDGHSSHKPTQAQINIVKSTVPILAQHGSTITTRFYENLLGENPSLYNIFNVANQKNGAQPRALATSVYAYAANIDNLAALSSAVELICNKHASLYVQPEHYSVVGTHLLRAMKEILGDALTDDVAEAWEVAYWQLADILIDTERKLYEKAHGWTDWRKFRIARKVPESDEITSFYLEPADHADGPLPSFLPGQYISIRTEVPALGGRKQPRQYSLSDAPNAKYYRISIKRESGVNMENPRAVAHPGYVSNLMHADKNEGDVVEVSHPYGEFTLDTETSSEAPVVLLSAGVGITAVLSMFNTLLKQGSSRPITFAHGARTASVRAFGEHLKAAAAEHDNVKVVLFNKILLNGEVKGVDFHQLGRLEVEALAAKEELYIDNPKTQYFACGPAQFMTQIEEDLKKMGVDGARIHAEMFGPSLGGR